MCLRHEKNAHVHIHTSAMNHVPELCCSTLDTGVGEGVCDGVVSVGVVSDVGDGDGVGVACGASPGHSVEPSDVAVSQGRHLACPQYGEYVPTAHGKHWNDPRNGE